MYNNYPQNPVYDSQTSVPFTEPTYSNPFETNQYAQTFPMNQFSQPVYNNVPSETPIYSVPTQQQYAPYPQYVDNTYMSQQPQQAVPQQPPPSYASAVQSPYQVPVQQQPVQNSNANPVQNTVKVQAAPFTQGYKWPRKSISLTCPKCGAQVQTRVETTPTIITFIGCVILFIFTVILFCVPFCIRACKKSTHYCPYCNSMLGTRKALR